MTFQEAVEMYGLGYVVCDRMRVVFDQHCILWDLTDYYVSGVCGGAVWLVKR